MINSHNNQNSTLRPATVAVDEIERLRVNQFRLNSLVQELRLEIAYYQGETKRLEWEKNVLKHDVDRLTGLFSGWLEELQKKPQLKNSAQMLKGVINDPQYLKALVKYPIKHISDILQLSDTIYLLTTCQPPYFVEYTNKAWCSFCGWECHEIVGLTCNFLQGEGTDVRTAASFAKDFKELGYAVMDIHNYNKNGCMFSVTATVFPVYDTISCSPAGSETPILTHFATVLTNLVPLSTPDAGLSFSHKEQQSATEQRTFDTSFNMSSDVGLNQLKEPVGEKQYHIESLLSQSQANRSIFANASAKAVGDLEAVFHNSDNGHVTTNSGQRQGDSRDKKRKDGGSHSHKSHDHGKADNNIEDEDEDDDNSNPHVRKHGTTGSNAEMQIMYDDFNNRSETPHHASTNHVVVSSYSTTNTVTSASTNTNTNIGLFESSKLATNASSLNPSGIPSNVVGGNGSSNSSSNRSSCSPSTGEAITGTGGVASGADGSFVAMEESTSGQDCDDDEGEGTPYLYDADASVNENEQDDNSSPSTLSPDQDDGSNSSSSSDNGENERCNVHARKSNDRDRVGMRSTANHKIGRDHTMHTSSSNNNSTISSSNNNNSSDGNIRERGNDSQSNFHISSGSGSGNGSGSGSDRDRDLNKISVSGTNTTDGSESTTKPFILPHQIVSGSGDLRTGCKKIDAECSLSSENFYLAAQSSLRLSDLLRLMVTCRDVLLLCDKFGRILHSNVAFINLFQYGIKEIEGHTLHFLYRLPSDIVLFEQCRMLNMRGESTDVALKGFRKSSSSVYCRVITVPLRGGVNSSEITHYVSHFKPLSSSSETISSSSPSLTTATSEEDAPDATRFRDNNATNLDSTDSASIQPANHRALLYDILHRIKCDSPMCLANSTRQSGTSNLIRVSSTGDSNSLSDTSGNNSSGDRADVGNFVSGSETTGSKKSPSSHHSSGVCPNPNPNPNSIPGNASMLAGSNLSISSSSSASASASSSIQNSPRVLAHQPLSESSYSYGLPQQQVPMQMSYPPPGGAAATAMGQSGYFVPYSYTNEPGASSHLLQTASPSLQGLIQVGSAQNSHHEQYYHHNHHDHRQLPPQPMFPDSCDTGSPASPLLHVRQDGVLLNLNVTVPGIHSSSPGIPIGLQSVLPNRFSVPIPVAMQVPGTIPYSAIPNIGAGQADVKYWPSPSPNLATPYIPIAIPSMGPPSSSSLHVPVPIAMSLPVPAILDYGGFGNYLEPDTKVSIPDVNPRQPSASLWRESNSSRSSSSSSTEIPPSVGWISVGGFIGGIVDSEQDHFHHSDHYHHGEGSTSGSDMETKSADEDSL